jgi:hypothetical protein
MPSPSKRNWKGIDIAKPLCPDIATPSAALPLLAAAVAFPMDAATTPYCGCARLFDGCTASTPAVRYLGIRIAPGSSGGRAAITRSTDALPVVGLTPNLCTSTYGGTTGNDIITVADRLFPNDLYIGRARAFYWGTWAGRSDIVMTADSDVIAPTATQDRLFELEPLLHPKVEPFSVSDASGFSFVVTKRVVDLSTL